MQKEGGAGRKNTTEEVGDQCQSPPIRPTDRLADLSLKLLFFIYIKQF